MAVQSIGAMLDELGVKLDVGVNQRLTSVFVVGKVMDLGTGVPYLVLGSNGMDWIDEGGLLNAAVLARSETIARRISSNAGCHDPNCDEHNSDE